MMKAALLYQLNTPLRIEEIPEPEIGPWDLLVRTATCGICRTDLHIQEGLAYVPTLPHIGGHEPAGIVVRCGSEVTGFQPGDRVIPYLFVTHTKEQLHDGHAPFPDEIEGIIGVTRAGGFAEFFAGPARNFIPIPDSVSFEAAGLVSCGVITAVHAFRRAAMKSGQKALVIGSGGIGVLLVQILKEAGMTVLATALSDVSCEVARKAGADFAIRAGDPDCIAEIQRFSGGGVDCAFDMVGRTATMTAAAASVRNRGKIVIIGEEPEAPAQTSIEIAQRELQIIGSRNGGLDDARTALQMLATGLISPHIDRRFGFHDINEALDCVRSGQAHGRVVVEFESTLDNVKQPHNL